MKRWIASLYVIAVFLGTLTWSQASRADGFSSAASLHQARFGHTATLLSSGKVLVVGGATADTILSSAELYEPATNTWTVTGALSAARLYHQAILLPSGKVLVAGGAYGATPLATAELYDPVTGQWSSAGSMSVARANHSMNLISTGDVLVAFGTSGANGTNKLNSADLYHPSTNSWSVAPSAPSARASFGAAVLADGSFLATGGVDTNGSPLASGYGYIPGTGWVGPVGLLATARYRFTMTPLNSGASVLAVGGLNTVPAPAGDGGTLRFFRQPVDLGRFDGNEALVAYGNPTRSGNVLVVAGVDENDNALSSAELYDPTSNSWSSTGGLAVARAQHTATLLPSGKVLVVGGQGAAPSYPELASCELYAVNEIFVNGFEATPN